MPTSSLRQAVTVTARDEVRTALAAGLRARRSEIVEAALARARSISDSTAGADPEYSAGLRAAVEAALEFGIAAIEHGEEDPPPIPPAVLAQARLAARKGVAVDTVLRRYFAGFALFNHYVRLEVEASTHPVDAQRLLQIRTAQFDRLAAAVSAEHARARENRFRSAQQRQTERVRRLLSGEPLDTEELGYDLDGSHLGAVATGLEAEEVVRELAARVDRRLLLVRPEESEVWAWLGGRRKMRSAEIEQLKLPRPSRTALSIGEPATGVVGWRLTHRQARVAAPIAARRPGECVRYARVALVASALGDEVLVASLVQLYLDPLAEEQEDGGAAIRRTLGAYFRAGHNTSAAAAALGVNRRTVSNRLREAEERLDCSLSERAAEIELALRLSAAQGGEPYLDASPQWRGDLSPSSKTL